MRVMTTVNTLFVFSDGAEEEKMETETDGQQSEKVSLARYTGSEEVVLTLRNLNYCVLKCHVRNVACAGLWVCPQGTVFQSSWCVIFL